MKTTKRYNLFRIITALVLALGMVLALTSCGNSNTESPATSADPTGTAAPEDSFDYSYKYPANPARELQAALEKAVADKNLPITVGGVEFATFGNVEQAKFTLRFTEPGDNVCVVTFNLKYALSDYDYNLDGHDNPSFVMAFKDPENTDDLKSVLALVLQYISPDLSDAEARRIAENQDATIAVDGYSQPLDIGGYQVTTRATNPQPFTHTKDFESSLGVEVTALKQIWGNVDIRSSKKMQGASDYLALTSGYPCWEDDEKDKSVYADFIVKNIWHHEEWVHGDYWTVVDVESMDGNHYTLRLETMRMSREYNFGVGQKYTIFIGTGSYYGAQIIYAVQQSDVSLLGGRGVPHEMDYQNPDDDKPKYRIEPEGDGTVYDVMFELVSRSIGDVYAVLEGHGVGAPQWPHDPGRDNYEFVGWFENRDGTGKAFTKDTPINQNTTLFAKWKYVGSGGIWPRAHHGEISGIEEGASLPVQKEFIITAAGYNMKLETPKDQRFRWQPVSWRLSDGTIGSFTAEAPFKATIILAHTGKQQLTITYSEEIFDGVGWQTTGQSREVEEVMLLGI